MIGKCMWRFVILLATIVLSFSAFAAGEEGGKEPVADGSAGVVPAAQVEPSAPQAGETEEAKGENGKRIEEAVVGENVGDGGGANGKVAAEELPYYEGTVTAVHGVDFLEIDGQDVRLAGVTGPRRWWWGEERDCFGVEGAVFLEANLLGKPVQYAFDPILGPDNKRGIRRAYILSEGMFVNAKLIEDGLALVDRSKGYVARERLLDLEEIARLRQIGLWHTCPVECWRDKVCRVRNW